MRRQDTSTKRMAERGRHIGDAHRIALVAVLIAIAVTARGQMTASQVVEDFAEEMAEEDRLTEEVQEGIAEMMQIAERKIDLNRADEEEIGKILFLSKHQIYSLLRHRRLAGRIVREDELRTVSGFDDLAVDRLMCFAEIGDSAETRRSGKPSSANSIVRLWGNVPKAKGYLGEEPKYLGGPVGTLIRTEVEGGRVWKAGLVLKNEPGEVAFGRGTTLTDYVGGYALYSNPYGTVRKVIAGNYNVCLGQGLGIWTGFTADVLGGDITGDRRANGIGKTMSSTAEMRGVATEVKTGRVVTTGYYSDSDLDGTIRKREDGSEYILTATAGGQHRTEGERKKRNAIRTRTAGGYIKYSTDGMMIGGGYNRRETDVETWHGNQEYRKNYMTGKTHTTIHIDGKGYMTRKAVYGEIAYQGKDAWGGVLGGDFRLRRTGGMVACAVRHFGDKYQAIQQNPRSRASAAGGESGVYVAATLSAGRRTEIAWSGDIYKERNRQSGKWSAEKGILLRGRSETRTGRRGKLTLGIRHSHREMRENDSTRTAYEALTRPKIAWTTEIEGGRGKLRLGTMVEGSRYSGMGKRAKGGVLCQTAQWTSDKEKVSINISADIFRTEDYEARVYSKQANVLYDMSFPTRNGRGMAGTMMVKLMPRQDIRIWLLGTHTRYLDREEVGTGNETTKGAGRSTIKVQVQWKWHR
ncbi:MAG: hypothetical protein II951_11055 [Bacteroidales bacterium]|nr:hypothetical protein [Bacteroidales bacterium]